ncbi:MAG: hypothetical protein HYX53_09585 [Chloroflexi bacterium]|nr:hypothetical protein [Chloroflexota bacterium]
MTNNIGKHRAESRDASGKGVDTLQRPRGSRGRIFDSLFRRWHRGSRDAAGPAAADSAVVKTARVLDELYSRSTDERARVDPGLYARYVWFGLHE